MHSADHIVIEARRPPGPQDDDLATKSRTGEGQPAHEQIFRNAVLQIDRMVHVARSCSHDASATQHHVLNLNAQMYGTVVALVAQAPPDDALEDLTASHPDLDLAALELLVELFLRKHCSSPRETRLSQFKYKDLRQLRQEVFRSNEACLVFGTLLELNFALFNGLV